MRVFFSVGEPSGDLHGANLIEELRKLDPHIQCLGFGGPRMQQAGCRLLEDMTDLAVMWLTAAVKNLGKFAHLLRRAEESFRQQRPDLVVLIDYPGFNWWVARKAKRLGIPVVYYGVPQMWAWASWRVAKMRRLVDHALCKLPFEAQWYQQRDCPATYVGHPYFDELRDRQLDTDFMSRYSRDRLVTLLPGSRSAEVEGNLPCFLKAAQRIKAARPTAQIAIASYNDKQAEMARRLLADHRVDAEIHVGKTTELIAASRCCLACSGSVSLELLYFARPAAIHYAVTRLKYQVAKALVKVKYITLANLLAMDDRFGPDLRPYDPVAAGAEHVPFPEYPTWQDRSEQLAAHALQWLDDSDAYRAKVAQLVTLRDQVVTEGASRTAARFIRDLVRQPTLPGRRAA